MKGLTEKQKNMIEFIDEFMNTVGMAPTIYEIAEHFKIKTSTVFAHIRALQKKSYLTRSSKARSIALTKARRKKMPAGAAAVPVIDGVSDNSTRAERELICDSKVFRRIANDRDLFAMHVKGSDLASLGILDGDIVIVKSHPESLTGGEIVVAEMGGKDVLRACFPKDQGKMEMRTGRPEDKCFLTTLAETPLKGVVIGLQRSI